MRDLSGLLHYQSKCFSSRLTLRYYCLHSTAAFQFCWVRSFTFPSTGTSEKGLQVSLL